MCVYVCFLFHPFKVSILEKIPTNSNRYLNGEINSTANVVLNEVRPVAHLVSYEIFEHIDIFGKIV